MKISRRQTMLATICKALAGDRHEERTTNLVPDHRRIRGLRLKLYWVFARLRYREAERLVRANGGLHVFESR